MTDLIDLVFGNVFPVTKAYINVVRVVFLS